MARSPPIDGRPRPPRPGGGLVGRRDVAVGAGRGTSARSRPHARRRRRRSPRRRRRRHRQKALASPRARAHTACTWMRRHPRAEGVVCYPLRNHLRSPLRNLTTCVPSSLVLSLSHTQLLSRSLHLIPISRVHLVHYIAFPSLVPMPSLPRPSLTQLASASPLSQTPTLPQLYTTFTPPVHHIYYRLLHVRHQ